MTERDIPRHSQTPLSICTFVHAGLHLILNINQNEYLTEGGDTAGLRMVVHPQTRMPFPEDEGITVSPGRATSVAIKQVNISFILHIHTQR